MGDFRKLRVWHQSRELTTIIYRTTDGFPRKHQFELTSQMRKAAISIMSNIAEGCGRNKRKELIRFLGIACGSANELSCQLILCRDLALLDSLPATELDERVAEVQRMLTGLIRHLTDS